MTFGRWLLVHSLSISILIMLGIGYFFKEELKLNEAYRQLLMIDSSELSINEITKNDVSAPTSTDSKPLLDNANAIDSDTSLQAASLSAKTVDIKTKTLEKKVELESVKSTQRKIVSTLAGTPFLKKREEDHLLLAREAYWQKDYDLAIEYYRLEIEKNPEVADLYGEVGNIYYGLSDFDTASHFYLKAGELFLNKSDDKRARQVYDILLSIAPAKAQVLLDLKNNKPY